jgi:feruloyl-CoA synthase
VPDWCDDPTLLAPRRVQREALADGGFVLRSPQPLGAYTRCVGEWLEHWARQRPEATAVAEPAPEPVAGDGWLRLNWRALRAQVGRVAQGLLNLKLAPGAPIVVLSDNSIEHFILLLAGMHIGQPVCSVSSAYSRLAAGDFSRLDAIFAALRPGLVFASDAVVYGAAMQRLPGPVPRVFGAASASVPEGALRWVDLQQAEETPAVMQAFAGVTPDTHAKYLLTSGSTGAPKVVINTQRMLCANQQMLRQILRFLNDAQQAPVLLDWLPWSHTFGANHNSNMVLCHGGTLYIDDGRPLPGLIDKTITHLREVQPNLYFNVPRGYDMLLPALEADDSLARAFFGRLRMLFYAGAGMPQSTWARLEAVARRCGLPTPPWFTTSWGSTETAPAVTFAHWRLAGPGVIGLPMPGAEVKFVPGGGKLEMRVRGPNVTPGYLHNEAATRAAFDDEGFYCIGDAGRLADDSDASRGIVFDGRVAEDFKLGNGSWVSVGTLRLRCVAALSPWVQDVVLSGHDGDEVGLLVFLSEAGRALPADTLRENLRAGLAALAASSGGSATQTPRRALVLEGPPSLATGEITDKGYLNQRLCLQRRAAEVQALFARPTDPRVIVGH